MKDLFVPYEIALQLKELGFDEPCFGIWIGRGSKYDVMYVAKQEDAWMAEQNDGILAPIFSQAFTFFREKYNLYTNIDYDWNDEVFRVKIMKQNEDKSCNIIFLKEGEYIKDYNCFEEAELECLKKLIEIVKNK